MGIFKFPNLAEFRETAPLENLFWKFYSNIHTKYKHKSYTTHFAKVKLRW